MVACGKVILIFQYIFEFEKQNLNFVNLYSVAIKDTHGFRFSSAASSLFCAREPQHIFLWLIKTKAWLIGLLLQIEWQRIGQNHLVTYFGVCRVISNQVRASMLMSQCTLRFSA